MKVYVVTYIHDSDCEMYVNVDTFLDMENAAKCYEQKRLLAIETARDDDPDSDEEIFRDMDICESKYNFMCRVPEDDETLIVFLQEKDAK